MAPSTNHCLWDLAPRRRLPRTDLSGFSSAVWNERECERRVTSGSYLCSCQWWDDFALQSELHNHWEDSQHQTETAPFSKSFTLNPAHQACTTQAPLMSCCWKITTLRALLLQIFRKKKSKFQFLQLSTTQSVNEEHYIILSDIIWHNVISLNGPNTQECWIFFLNAGC